MSICVGHDSVLISDKCWGGFGGGVLIPVRTAEVLCAADGCFEAKYWPEEEQGPRFYARNTQGGLPKGAYPWLAALLRLLKSRRDKKESASPETTVWSRFGFKNQDELIAAVMDVPAQDSPPPDSSSKSNRQLMRGDWLQYQKKEMWTPPRRVAFLGAFTLLAIAVIWALLDGRTTTTALLELCGQILARLAVLTIIVLVAYIMWAKRRNTCKQCGGGCVEERADYIYWVCHACKIRWSTGVSLERP